MTTSMTYLALTALLTGALWVPYVIALVQTYGLPGPPQYADPRTSTNTEKPLPLWGVRANRAHLNAVEAFAPFAVLVLIAHAVGKENATVAFCAMSFSGSGSPMPPSCFWGCPTSARSCSRSVGSRKS